MRASGALLFALLLLIAGPAAGEQIEVFDVEIHLETDGSFVVVEKIAYDFGAETRHGIFRDIPVRYERGFEGSTHIDLDVEEVTDAAGRARPHRVIDEGRSRRIRIGAPDRTVSGRQDYWIRYRVRHATRFFESHDELYWNVTGHEWRVPIGRASARVFLPRDVEPRLRCLAGPLGSTGGCVVEAGLGTAGFSTAALPQGHGLTVVVGLEKGVLEEPSAWIRGWRRFARLGGLWLLTPIFTLLGMHRLWLWRGRDPVVSDAIPVRYDPPEDLSPGEVGTLVDESADPRDLSAGLLDLAVRGHLEIHEVESTRFLFLKSSDYRLHRKHNEADVLRPHERLLLRGLFEQGEIVSLSSLKDRFYEHIPGIRNALYDGLAERGYFAGSPSRVRRKWVAGAIAAAVVLVAIASLGSPPRPLVLIAVAISGLIAVGFGMRMPRRTRRGRRACDEVLGFKEFVARVDADRLERLGKGSLDRFERALPYAMVLGVADPWAEAFAGLYLKPPSWYRSDGSGPFDARHFVSDLGQSLDTIEQTLTSSPSSSGGGGSGFGGGGSSGGGFGGGGGGSW